MDDKYFKLLVTLRGGIEELKLNPDAPEITQIPSATFRLQLLGYVTNLSKRGFNQQGLYPANFADPKYLESLGNYLDADIKTYEQSPKKINTISQNLPNWYLLVRADQIARAYAQNKTQEEKPLNTFLESARLHNENLINNLNSGLAQTITLLNPNQQIQIKQQLETAVSNATLLPAQDPTIIKQILKNKALAIAADLKQQGLIFDEVKVQKEIEGFTNAIVPKIQETARVNRQIETYTEQINTDISWQTTKTAFASAVSAPVAPHVISLAAAQLAHDASLGQNPNLNDTAFTNLIAQKTRQILQSPLFSGALNPNLSPDEIANQIAQIVAPQIKQLAKNWQRDKGVLSPEQQANAWSQVAASPHDSPRINVSDLPSPPGNTEIYLSRGMPAKWLIAAADARSGENLLKWTIKGGPIKSLVNAATVAGSGYLSGSLQEYIIKEAVSEKRLGYEEYYTQMFFRLSQKPIDQLSPEEYYDFKEAEKALNLIKSLKLNMGLMEKSRFRNFFLRGALPALEWLQPIQTLKLKLIRTSSFKGLLAYVGVDMMVGIAQRPDLALFYLAQYPKMFATLAWKKLGLQLGLYEITGSPMFKHYEFKKIAQFKKWVGRGLNKAFSAVTQKIFGAATSAAISTAIGTFTGGLGLAFGILAKFYTPLKKFAQAAGLLVFGLIIQFGLPGIIGAVVGFIVGGIAGGILGAKLGIFLLGWIPGVGPIAGAIIGFVTGFVIGSGICAVVFAYLGHLIAEGVAIVGSALSSSLGPLTASLAKSFAAFGAQIGIISLATVSSLTIYTFWVVSSAFFVPPGDLGLLGSKYINIDKKAFMAGQTPQDVQIPSLPNSVLGSNIFYEISVNPLLSPLKDIKVTDKMTITNKDGSVEFTKKYSVVGSPPNFSLKDPINSSWDKSADPALENLDLGSSWNKVYGFNLTDNFKDSYVSNTVTVEAKRPFTDASGNLQESPETKSFTRTLRIGNPPLAPAAFAAEKLINELIKNYGPQITRDNLGKYGDNGAKLNGLLKNETISQLTASVNEYIYLQCVGFVQAVLAESGLPLLPTLPRPGYASQYFGKDSGNYKWRSSSPEDLANIQSGDILVSQKDTYGHVAIITSVTGNGYWVAEALGVRVGDTPPGTVQLRYEVFLDRQNDPDIGYLHYVNSP